MATHADFDRLAKRGGGAVQESINTQYRRQLFRQLDAFCSCNHGSVPFVEGRNNWFRGSATGHRVESRYCYGIKIKLHQHNDNRH
jgi:hypothetical protein